MVFVLFGPPGVGKGTQGAMISAQYHIPTISTGLIFRENVIAGTPLGVKVKDMLARGSLVPDNLVIELVMERVSRRDCRNGFLLDGCPRTVGQAESLETMLGPSTFDLKGVLHFEVGDDVLIHRLSGRRVCPHCCATFHVEGMPPKITGVCDRCGGGLVQRSDDRPEAIRNRLLEYHAKTEPLIAFYHERGLLRRIDASGSPKEIHARADQAIQASL